jgi:hypothetical protein
MRVTVRKVGGHLSAKGWLRPEHGKSKGKGKAAPPLGEVAGALQLETRCGDPSCTKVHSHGP